MHPEIATNAPTAHTYAACDDRLVWHYTTGFHWSRITESGALLPIPTPGAYDSERPVVWLSLAQVWEKTASKGLLLPTGELKTLTMEETGVRCGGLVRVGLRNADVPLTFKDFGRMSRVPQVDFRGLRAVGKRQGADPDQWRVSFDPLPTDLWAAVETWSGSEWQPTLANLRAVA